MLKNAWIILIQEKNSNHTANIQDKFVREYMRNVYVLREELGGDAGVNTSPARKTLYYTATMLKLRSRAVRIAGDLIVSREPYGVPDRRVQQESMVDEFIAQMKRCKLDDKPIPNDQHKKEIKWSGKLGEDGKIQAGQNDDIAFSFSQLSYWSSAFMTEQIKTIDYKKEFGGGSLY